MGVRRTPVNNDRRFSCSIIKTLRRKHNVISENYKKKHIYSICEKSAEINPNYVFKKVIIADLNKDCIIPDEVGIECCGNVHDEEMLFRSSDGGYYFSL